MTRTVWKPPRPAAISEASESPRRFTARQALLYFLLGFTWLTPALFLWKWAGLPAALIYLFGAVTSSAIVAILGNLEERRA